MNRRIKSLGLAAAAFVASTLIAEETRADAPVVSRATVGADTVSYYDGERVAAYLVLSLGVAAVGGGAVLATRDGDFARGLGWTLVSMGGLEVLGGLAYAVGVGAELDHYRRLLARDPAAYRADESQHMRGTTSRFVIYRVVELSLAVAGAGLATYGFASQRVGWQGIGIGVASVALPFFVIDTVNQARASYYEDHVRRFAPSIGLRLGDRAASLALVGRF